MISRIYVLVYDSIYLSDYILYDFAIFLAFIDDNTFDHYRNKENCLAYQKNQIGNYIKITIIID